jgi:hypothetical protein
MRNKIEDIPKINDAAAAFTTPLFGVFTGQKFTLLVQ